MKLSNVQQAILIECHRRTEELATTEPPPTWQSRAHERYRDEIECGPLYSCHEWFGKSTDAERMRAYRAVRVLEDLELVEATRFEGFRTRTAVHLKLTAEGERVVRELLNKDN